jgi:hypothetical protein
VGAEITKIDDGNSPFSIQVDRFYTSVEHIIAGLTVGLSLSAIHMFVVALNLTGKPTTATWTAVGCGLCWTVLSICYGLYRAWTNPILQLRTWGAAAILVPVFVLSVCVCGVLLLAIAFSGYC